MLNLLILPEVPVAWSVRSIYIGVEKDIFLSNLFKNANFQQFFHKTIVEIKDQRKVNRSHLNTN